jgi:hypothetical protein
MPTRYRMWPTVPLSYNVSDVKFSITDGERIRSRRRKRTNTYMARKTVIQETVLPNSRTKLYQERKVSPECQYMEIT